jgi:hypothetical protein
MTVKKPETVKDALMMSARAAVKREIADNMAERGDYHASWERAEADEMDEGVGKFLDIGSHTLHVTGPVKPGNGGEMLVVTRDLQADVPGLVDTVRERPSMLAAEASESRLRLTGNAMVQAVDAAESINARNSLRRCWRISSPPCTGWACSRRARPVTYWNGMARSIR